MKSLPAADTSQSPSRPPSSALQVLLAFLKLGLTSFGGPIAHLGYFRHQFVERRRWLDDAEFAELVALCQFLPGPASSQVGIAIGLKRAGPLGALAAWLGFTLPSALLMAGFAQHFAGADELLHAPWVHGLLIAAVAVVAQAVWSMGRQFCAGRMPLAIALIAAFTCTLAGNGLTQLLVLAAAAAAGWLLLPITDDLRPRLPGEATEAAADAPAAAAASRRGAIAALLVFAGLLIGLPIAASMTANHALALADRFFRTGSLVFGGGHVVLPLLQAQVVPPGWISNQSFLAGYAAAQAVPGPLFTFAGYLGAAMGPAPNGWPGAALCLLAIFLPSFLLVFGVMPFWSTLRQGTQVRSALRGVNAAVVGVLLSALYQPVFVSAIHTSADFAVALAGFLLLLLGRLPSWSVLLLCTGYALVRAGAG
jgi:chromate transporter